MSLDPQHKQFATLGLPVRITELDIDSNDEELQADYFRDFLTASFSHPNINGIMIWGFWEGGTGVPTPRCIARIGRRVPLPAFGKT